MLTTQTCLSAEKWVHSVRNFSASYAVPLMSRLAADRKFGWVRPQVTKVIYQTIYYHAHQEIWWWIRWEGRMFEVMAFIFRSNCCIWWSPAFLDITKPLAATGKELIPCFVLIRHTAFALPIMVFWSQFNSCSPVGSPHFLFREILTLNACIDWD